MSNAKGLSFTVTKEIMGLLDLRPGVTRADKLEQLVEKALKDMGEKEHVEKIRTVIPVSAETVRQLRQLGDGLVNYYGAAISRNVVIAHIIKYKGL